MMLALPKERRGGGLHVSNPVRVSGRLPEDKDVLVHELELGLGRFPEWQQESVPSKGAEGRMIV